MSIFLTGIVTALTLTAAPASQPALTQELVTLERVVLDGWVKGDPDPNLALTAEEISYVDTGIHQRLDGLPAVRKYFEEYRGKPLFDSYEISNARVQGSGKVVVLSYRLLTNTGPEKAAYECTEVYQKQGKKWLIIHSHFSRAK